MKRGAFELGGSDPLIVFEDADLELASSKAVISRLHTNGQACNNSKRFLIHEKVYDEFVHKLIQKVKSHVKMGDPLDPSTTIGPLSMAKQV
jgi:succinate-semialdehyde dehydrogenase/glutarate-semialdehyde dehydrogenase